jgi:hypothetical protein
MTSVIPFLESASEAEDVYILTTFQQVFLWRLLPYQATLQPLQDVLQALYSLRTFF